MSYTKRQFIEAAYEEIGYAGYTFDLQPEQLEMAMRRLDSLMAQWNSKGIRLGYPVPSSPEDSSLDTETGVPDYANQAVYQNLAVLLAPTVGKQVMAETRAMASEGYRVLLARAAMPMEQKFPNTLPTGAGNKPWRYTDPFIQDLEPPLLSGGDGPIQFN